MFLKNIYVGLFIDLNFSQARNNKNKILIKSTFQVENSCYFVCTYFLIFETVIKLNLKDKSKIIVFELQNYLRKILFNGSIRTIP